jgi:sulfite exporter TauE/SafE
MIEAKSTVPVTRGQLYMLAAPLYTLVAFALLGVMRADVNTLQTTVFIFIGDIILFCVAVFSGIALTIMGMRERKREREAVN